MASTDSIPETPRWLHWLAVLIVALTLPLLTLGAEVTTKGIGMVDRAPVRSPVHLVSVLIERGGLASVLNAEDLGLAWLIEHTHRAVGWLVGLLAITLALSMAFFESRRWLRWAAFAALLAITSQGLLGALRVELGRRLDPDATTVALIHGCTAQLVFAFLVGMALWTSAAWQRIGSANVAEYVPIRRASLALVGVMYVQIAFGAVMRHKELVLGTRLHILLAFAVVAAAVWLGVRVFQTQPAGSIGRRAVAILGLLLALQVVLGLETMLSKFTVSWYTGERVEPVAGVSELIRSIHFLVGALTFASAASIAFIAHRHVAWTFRPVTVSARQLEGAI